MHIPTLLTALTAFASLGSADKPKCHTKDNDLVVKTKQGSVRGTVNAKFPTVRQFLGIPFAQPPLGDLRFAPPEPAGAFPNGHFNTTAELPPSCVQFLTTQPQVYTRNILEFNLGGLNTTGRISEDCLTLSVWAPNGQQKKLPVLIFFYGGAFSMGGQDVPYQIPSQWVQRSQSHIVVTFNYRVNIFGFPNAAGLDADKQNLGLLDQRLAVEWVHDNIEAFGGDKSRIGIWGQSSGAISVGYYSYAYPDNSLVSSIIQDSGTEFLDVTVKDPTHTNFTFVAANVGCGNLTPAQELACMRNANAFALEGILQANPIPILYFGPIVDNRTVFGDYSARALAGKVAPAPAIIGSTTQDGNAFLPWMPNGPDPALSYATTLLLFFCPAFKAATTRLQIGRPVYRYEYAGNFSNISPAPWLGAYHESELPLIFGTHPNFRGPSTPLEYATSNAMQDAWLAFISKGEVGLASQAWPEYTSLNSLVREFGAVVPAQSLSKKAMEAMCLPIFQPAAGVM